MACKLILRLTRCWIKVHLIERQAIQNSEFFESGVKGFANEDYVSFLTITINTSSEHKKPLFVCSCASFFLTWVNLSRVVFRNVFFFTSEKYGDNDEQHCHRFLHCHLLHILFFHRALHHESPVKIQTRRTVACCCFLFSRPRVNCLLFSLSLPLFLSLFLSFFPLFSALEPHSSISL